MDTARRFGFNHVSIEIGRTSLAISPHEATKLMPRIWPTELGAANLPLARVFRFRQ
jgi:hypothetical protein